MIGADERQLVAVAKALREAKDKGLNKALRQATNRAAEPAKTAVSAKARAVLPAHGGLAERVARSKWRLQKLAGKAPGFVLIMRLAKEHGGGLVDLRRMNKGKLRHPLPNTRRVWVTQRVPSGWFEAASEPVKTQVARDLRIAVQDMADELASRSGRGGS